MVLGLKDGELGSATAGAVPRNAPKVTRIRVLAMERKRRAACRPNMTVPCRQPIVRCRKCIIAKAPRKVLKDGMQGGGRKITGPVAPARRPREKKAGWVARTRSLAEPLSPRGPQPVVPL